VYQGRLSIQSLAASAGARYHTYAANNIEAAAVQFTDHVHLSVCGTNDEYDWAINKNSSIQQIGICYSHKGFADAAVWLAERLLSQGFSSFVGGRKLYIGGHSAGGAIAEILPLYDERLTPRATFTFGAPKWCEAKSSADYRVQPWDSHRFVMPYDPVPYLPLTLWRRALGLRYFSHTSKAYQIHDEGDWDDAEEITAAERVGSAMRSTITAGVANALGAFRNIFSFQCHQSWRYFQALEKASKQYRP
jgi:hypothetical protein